MWIRLPVQPFQYVVPAAVAEEHDRLSGWFPPDNCVGSSYQNAFGQDLCGRRLAEFVHQVRQHLWRNQMAGAKVRLFALVDHFVERHEWVPVGEAVIAALPVDEQDPAQPEFLAGADADAGVHRQSPGLSQRSLPPWPDS